MPSSNEIKTTYSLAMAHRSQLCPKPVECPGLRIELMDPACPEYSRFLHAVVGSDYRWGGRTDWDRERWSHHVDQVDTWIAYLRGTPVGYFELEKHPEGDVQIVCFGLLPQFVGAGLGGHLLTEAIQHAWEMGASNVWVRTCSHDHPHALKNYLTRGFELQKTEQGPANPPAQSYWERMSG